MEKANLPFQASEIATLWQQYMQDTMAFCFLQYFEQCAEDPEIRSTITKMLELVQESVQTMKAFFEQEKLPVPVGFTEHDVKVNAARLYTDAFMLQFISFLTHVATQSAGSSITVTSRADLRQFFMKRVNDMMQLGDQIFEILLEKGLFSKSPYIPFPEHVEFVQKQKFLSDLFGDRRPLNVVEINHLFINCLRNAQGMELLTGFAQTVQADEIREYFLKGKEMSKKYMEWFNSQMVAEDLPPNTLPGVGVLASTEAPFSDKLMLNMIEALNIYAMAVYSNSMVQSSRSDLTLLYTRVITETANYSSEGAKLLVKLSYLEAPPQLPDRDELAKEN